MSDSFAVLGFEPGLCLSEEELTEAYDERCREHHPDRGGEAGKFAAVQEAYAVLRDPGRRLRAWVEQQGGKVGAVTDEETLAWFSRVGELLARADEVRSRKEKGQSALVRAMAGKEALPLLGEIEDLRGELEVIRGEIVARFREFEEGGADGFAEAIAAAGRWTFLDRWDGELRERWISLGM